MRQQLARSSAISALSLLQLGIASMLLQFAGPSHASTIIKCTVDGKLIYQDTPCNNNSETVEQWTAKQERYKELHKKLDRLAALGYGMRQQPPPQPVVRVPQAEDTIISHHRMSRMERFAQDEAFAKRVQEQAEKNNAQSGAALSKIIEQAEQKCGGKKLADYPVVGMSDESFRLCTIQARFNHAMQVVVSDDAGVPLRLYIYQTERASRVYSIDGVVTAVSP
jgi:hypothetical protein